MAGQPSQVPLVVETVPQLARCVSATGQPDRRSLERNVPPRQHEIERLESRLHVKVQMPPNSMRKTVPSAQAPGEASSPGVGSSPSHRQLQARQRLELSLNGKVGENQGVGTPSNTMGRSQSPQSVTGPRSPPAARQHSLVSSESAGTGGHHSVPQQLRGLAPSVEADLAAQPSPPLRESTSEIDLSAAGPKLEAKHLAAEYLRPRASSNSHRYREEELSDKFTYTQEMMMKLREEQARQAHRLEVAEARIAREVSACRESIAEEVARFADVESRLEKKFKAMLEEEAAVRRAVESHIEARVVALKSEILTAMRSEVVARTKEMTVLRDRLEQAAQSMLQETSTTAAPMLLQPSAKLAMEEEDLKETDTSRPQHQARKSRSPKKCRLEVMQPWQEQPDKERLEKLDEAIEREVTSRTSMENRMEEKLGDMGNQLDGVLMLLSNIFEESKLQEAPAKWNQQTDLREKMRAAWLRTSRHWMLESTAGAEKDLQPDGSGASATLGTRPDAQCWDKVVLQLESQCAPSAA